ncbi:hypothetical protein [Micrococcus sp. KRD096]|uniref:hypothetical protein n=1 Tax=Micrococcus sp. KRD096 TaxID=2729721 RepID=UPI0019D310C2|nr:hypothetical protein [Micrococcus sp. KRD096]
MASVLHAARQVKHAGFVALKKAKFAAGEVKDVGYRGATALRPYVFDAGHYPLDFVSLDTPDPVGPPQAEVPRVIWCVWSGDNPMTPNRLEAMDSIRNTTPGVEIRLVTPDNLEQWVVPGHPLHEAYPYLSNVHRSDYLQAYLLHHHGGGYTGVKKHPTPWTSAFETMDRDPEAWVVGYQVPRSAESAWFEGRLGRDVRRNFSRLVGLGGMVVRANTQLTSDWLGEVERRLDYYTSLLKRSPGNVWGDNPSYPIPWTKICSQVFEPLCLRHLDRVRIDPAVKPQLWGHR